MTQGVHPVIKLSHLAAAFSAALLLCSTSVDAKTPYSGAALSSDFERAGDSPQGTPTLTTALDISGRQSPGLACSADPTTRPTATLNLGAGAVVTGLGWNVILETIGESWASEARISFGTQSQRVLINLNTGSGVNTSTPPGGQNFSGGPIDLSDAGIPNIVLDADGLLYVTFCETFVDNTGAADANYLPPSTLTVQCFNCSEPAPVIELSPASLAFGSVNVGSSSAAQNFTIANTGTAAGQITAINIDTPFARATGGAAGSCGTPPFSVAAGSSCTVGVVFSPSATGAASGSASVSVGAALDGDSTSGGMPPALSVALTGTGTAPAISFNPTSLNFGTVAPGATSAPQTLTVSNTGTGAGSITSPTVVAPFAQTGGTCPAGTFDLAAGASCTYIFTFSPAAEGPANTSFSFTVNGSPVVVSAVGLGAPVAPPPVARPAVVPVDSPWALLLLVLGLGGFGAIALRRHG